MKAPCVTAMIVAVFSTSASGQDLGRTITQRGDSIVVRMIDVDVRTAVQALAPYLEHPVVIGNVPAVRVSIETPSPIARSAAFALLREVLDTYSLELSLDSTRTLYRVRPKDVPRQAAPAEQPTSGRGQQETQLFVIRLRHAKASEVAATVNALYGRASALGEIGERPTTLSRDLLRQQVPPVGVSDPQSPQAVARGATLTGEITIVPDPRANSLLVRASRPDFELIQVAVEQLDVRPLQVLIEVLIAEVRRDRALDFGVETTLPKTSIAKTENTTIEGRIAPPAGLGDLAIKVMGISGLDVDATIRAAASRGDARIINRPVLLAANNERAEINVGSQRPFVQVARVLPTDNTARDQIIQYRDVGTRLSVVPTISDDGYVMLQVVQEINAATAEQQFNAPVISSRSVETRLLVKDGQTIVLGGLTDKQRENTKTGVPFLSSLPWIGALFGRHTSQRSETELLLFVTPRLLRDDFDTDAVTSPLRKRAARIEP
jgi:general secretion pathway protein D